MRARSEKNLCPQRQKLKFRRFTHVRPWKSDRLRFASLAYYGYAVSGGYRRCKSTTSARALPMLGCFQQRNAYKSCAMCTICAIIKHHTTNRKNAKFRHCWQVCAFFCLHEFYMEFVQYAKNIVTSLPKRTAIAMIYANTL